MDTRDSGSGRSPSRLGRRAFVIGSLAAGATVALAGCGRKDDVVDSTQDLTDGSTIPEPAGEAGEQESRKGGTLKYYINNPVAIDPFNVQEDQGMQVAYQLFDTLTTYDFEAGEIVGLAAESWEANETADVFTFKLVPGATFHNGDPVTSVDFKFAWERIVNPETNPGSPSDISYHLSTVSGYDEMLRGERTDLDIETPDEHTLVVNLSAPYADFPYVTTHPALSPVPSGGATADFRTYTEAPIGNGPFKMDGSWEDAQHIRLTRYDDYHGEPVNVDGIDFVIYKDPETAYSEFEAGNLDFTMIPPGRIDDVRDRFGESPDGYTINPGEQVLLGPTIATYLLVMNAEDEVMANKDVRRALSFAINRQAICDTLFSGSRIPADGVIPPGVDGYEEGAWEAARYDKAAAEQALVDAGYPGGEGLELDLLVSTGGGHEQIMQMVQADLQAIGITSTIATSEWAAYLDMLSDGSYQVARIGWTADYPTMENFLYSMFYTGSSKNRAHYSNPEADRLMDVARRTVDDAERVEAMKAADAVIAEDLPVIPLMFYRHTRVGSGRVHDLYYSPINLADLSRTWLED